MPANHKPVVVVGSINTDLVAGAALFPSRGETVLGSSFDIHPGGKGANQAVAVSRLGYPVQLIGKVGADVFGEQSRNYLQSTGVDVNGVEVGSGTSGVAIIAVSPAGDNSIIVVPGVRRCHLTLSTPAAAAISVTRRGAQPSMPGRDEVKRLMQTKTF